MATRMLIDARHPEETRVAVLQGNRIEEFDFESAEHKQIKGNIYLAKVTRVEPSLQAAFVDFGGNRHGFLAFSEIHPDYYQIPKADRDALLAEEAEAAEEEERLRAEEEDEGISPGEEYDAEDDSGEALAEDFAENGVEEVDTVTLKRRNVEPPRSDALRNRDERLKLALWASGEQFWDYDLVQRRLYRMRADETAVQTSDITVLTRQGEVPTIHEEDLPLVMERLRLHLQGKAPIFTSEHRMDMQGNGTWVWVRARGRVVERDADGQPVRIAGTARDITASRNAEYEHRIAGEVMRSMNEAVAVLDWAHQFITINPAFTRITGYAEEEIIGQPMTMLDSDQHEDSFFERMHRELRLTGRWSGEIWKVRKDGEEILCRIETNVVPDATGERPLYVQVLTDITEQKRAEAELAAVGLAPTRRIGHVGSG